jgi:sulfite exporter TauE/SafE
VTSLAHAARRARSSDAADWGARSGIVARGLLWLIVGVLAGNIAVGGHDQADKNGALATLRDQPMGKLLLVLVALAFAAHACFRLLEAAVGKREWWKRLWQLCRVGVYGFLAGSTVKLLVTGPKRENAAKPTAHVMGWPAGRWLVGIVGAAIIITGVTMAVRGLRQDFTERLKLPRGRMRRVVETAGVAGLCGRGLVYALVGGFLVQAAVQFDPNKAKGLDASLKTLARQPFGAVLLWVAVAALLSFAAWSFLEARYRKI